MAVAIVGGALANKPFNGGEAWVRLSWALGLERLGFETYLVEQIDAERCVDERGRPAPFAASASRAWFESVTGDFGLEGRAALLCDGGREAAGIGLEGLAAIAAGADVLFNLSGHLTFEPLLAAPRRRVYVDLDPGFTQGWHADPGLSFRLGGHDDYVTVGLNVGRRGCPIPAGGIEWLPTLPPVLLAEWAAQPPPASARRFTTVASWRNGFGPLELGARRMGLKHHQFRRFLELPERVEGAEFELALAIDAADAADREALLAHGWRLVDTREAAGTPRGFRDYVASSAAEFSVAQGVYAEARSGWFSDRAAAYLACGRPALGQDTALGAELLADGGFLAFSTLEEAVEGAGRILAGYEEQSAAARAFAARHLDSDAVLAELLARLGVGTDG